MSIRIDGTLLVKKIASRNGPFCVGELQTEIGEFKVKDSLVDQFEEGKYQGRFWISQIYAHSYFAYGKVIIEIRARLADFQIKDESALPGDLEKVGEVDPAEEEITAPKMSTDRPPVAKPVVKPVSGPAVAASTTKESATAVPTVTAISTATVEAFIDNSDLDLFGEEQYALVKKRLPIKLDSATDDRMRFRNQIARLGKLGYVFAATNQTWSVPV